MEPDATQQHKQEELEQMIQLLPEELQSLCASGKAVLDLAHLVKNVLQMVSGSTEIIELTLERKEYERIPKSWAIFEPNFMRLKKFLLDLIKYTKQYPLHIVSCDVNNVIRKAIAHCECTLKRHPAKLQFVPGDGLPAAALDSERVVEIAVNLITHALDNLPEHAGSITVKTNYLTPGKEIELMVADDAPALPLHLVRSLRVPSERTRNMCGTGFEIPLAGLYAQQHGGYMEIDATPPKGNAVHVYLPVVGA